MTEELESALAAKTAAEWVELLQEGGLMACLAYTWKQVVGTPLFAENELALQVGSGDDAITVIRTPARYFELRRRGHRSPAGGGPAQRRVSGAPSPRRETQAVSLTVRSLPRSAT